MSSIFFERRIDVNKSDIFEFINKLDISELKEFERELVDEVNMALNDYYDTPTERVYDIFSKQCRKHRMIVALLQYKKGELQ